MAQSKQVRGVATTVATDNTGLHVTYHRTIVFSQLVDGRIILRTGGWKTATTKLRMNQAFNQYGPRAYVGGTAARFSVYQDNHEWYVSDRSTNPWRIIPFEGDSLILVPDDMLPEAAQCA